MGHAGDAPSAHTVLTVDDLVQETPTSVSLIFERPPGDDFGYRPGQFLTFRVPSEVCGGVARCYSMSSSPDTDDHLKVTVKRTADGYASNWICDHATVGTQLEVLPPAGTFTPRNYDNDLLLFAGGSGITPIISIIKSVLARGCGKSTVVYANRYETDVIFARELDRLCRAHPRRLSVIHWLDSLQGMPTPDLLAGLVLPFSASEFFLCGPAPFMAIVRAGLVLAGVDARNVHAEVFTSLTGDPFAVADRLAEHPSATAEAAKVHVELDGQIHTLEWPRNQTLVEMLIAADIDVPHACREGECGACACTVTDGEVVMDRSEILDPDDIARGVALGCQTRPVTDEVTVTFDE